MRRGLALLSVLMAFPVSAQGPVTGEESVEVEGEAADGDAGGDPDGDADAAADADGVEADADADADGDPDADADADAGGDAERLRVAVLVVAATAADEAAADGLSEVLIGAIALRGAVEIVGKEEMQALLQQGEARSLECVTSPPCLGRIGVQLRVDQAVVGTLSQEAGTWSFDLTRLDVRTGETLGRVFREVEGDVGAVAGAMLEGVPTLYEPLRRPARLRFAANVEARLFVNDRDVGVFVDAPLVIEDLDAGTLHLRAEPTQEGHRPWERELELEPGADLRVEASLDRVVSPVPPPPPPLPQPGVSPIVWVGTGLAVAGGAIAIGFGARSQREVSDGVNRAAAVAFIEDRQRDALLANIGLATLAAGVAVGIVGLLLSDFGREGRLQAGVAPSRRGASVVVGGSL